MSSGFLNRLYTDQAVQLKKTVRGLKFQIFKEVVGLYYPCSKNKGTDQLYGYMYQAAPHLFSHMQKAGFLIWRLK